MVLYEKISGTLLRKIVLGFLSVVYTFFCFGILLNPRLAISIAFNNIDKTPDFIFSKSIALSFLAFTIPSLYFIFKKKNYSIKVMLYSLIPYHILPIYLSLKNFGGFVDKLPNLSKWHGFILTIIILSLMKQSKDK